MTTVEIIDRIKDDKKKQEWMEWYIKMISIHGQSMIDTIVALAYEHGQRDATIRDYELAKKLLLDRKEELDQAVKEVYGEQKL